MLTQVRARAGAAANSGGGRDAADSRDGRGWMTVAEDDVEAAFEAATTRENGGTFDFEVNLGYSEPEPPSSAMEITRQVNLSTVALSASLSKSPSLS